MKINRFNPTAIMVASHSNVSVFTVGIGLCAAFLVVCTASIAHAAITWSGDLSPTDPTKWTIGTGAYVGSTSSGTITVDSGSQILSRYAYLGLDFGSDGTVTVTGAGSKWTNDFDMFVGMSGNGTLTVDDGGTVNIGHAIYANLTDLHGNGTITAHGAVLDTDLIFDAAHELQQTIAFGTGGNLILTQNMNGALGVGYKDNGTLRIADGKTVSSEVGYLGYFSGSVGAATVTGTGTKWADNHNLIIGNMGDGSLRIEAGGQVTNVIGYLGKSTSSTGRATVTGAGSKWINYGALYIGDSGSGAFTVDAGGQIFSSGSFIANNSGSTGTATISGAGSKWTSSGNFFIGGSGNGTLRIEAGGQINSSATFSTYLGYSSASTGVATITGAGSQWVNNDYLYVGNAGNGTLNIEAGGGVGSRYGYVGYMPGSIGTAKITGQGSQWGSDTLYIGKSGKGILNIEAGGQNISSFGYAGYDVGTVGTMTITGAGSKWSNTNILYIGYSGDGEMNIDGGAQVSDAKGYLAYNLGSKGTVTVSGANSKWTHSSDLFIGNSGSGTLRVEAGGQVTDATGYLGFNPGSSGTAIITGAGSQWINSGYLMVGGALYIEAGGEVSNTYGNLGYTGSTDTVTVTGAGSKWTNKGGLAIGLNGSGTLLITAGGQVTSATSRISANIGSTGTVIVTGTDSQWTSGSLHVGASGSGTLTVNDGGKVVINGGLFGSLNSLYGNSVISTLGAVMDGDLIFDATHGLQQTFVFGTGGNLYLNQKGTGELGAGHKGNGTLRIADGIEIPSSNGFLGYEVGSTGTATVTGPGSKWNSGSLLVGFRGSGALRIEGGGQVSSTGGSIGHNGGAAGQVTVNGVGSKWISSGVLNIGNAGNGTLNIEAGAQVSSTSSFINDAANSVGVVRVTGNGSLLTNSNNLGVGRDGSGMLTVEAGGEVSTAQSAFLAFNLDSTGLVTVTGNGSKWTVKNNLDVGYYGKSTLNIGNGSESGAIVAAKIFTLAYDSRSTGICNISGGTLQVGTISQGTGTAKFNWIDGMIQNYDANTNLTISSTNNFALLLGATGMHAFNIDAGRTGTVDATLADATSGGTVTKLGDGLLTLTAANTYSGDTNVEGGTLSIRKPYLNDLAGIHIASGAKLDLGFVGSDTVGSLYLDDLLADFGTWGSSLSSATHIDDVHFSGTGVLNVVPEPSTLAFLFTAIFGGILWWRRKR